MLSDFISVTGSKSGKISGDLILSTDEKTIIFKPDAKFEPGEMVNVKILKGIQTISGENLAAANFEFKITPLLRQPNPYQYVDELENAYYPIKKSLNKALADTIPSNFPPMNVEIMDTSAIGEGYIFMAVASDVEGVGYYLMILNNDGTPFFARELKNDYSYDFETYPYTRATRPIVSAFHLNTINLDVDNNFFLATPLWVKKINRQTGEIIWHLGNYENEFSFVGVDSLDGLSHFGGHAFYRIPNGNVLIYDNGARRGTQSSQVHEYRLDEENKIAEHIWTYEPDTVINAWHRGNAQRLPNGNTVIGWGGSSGNPCPAFTEVNSEGEKVMEISFIPPDIESYRAYRFPFPDGQPSDIVTITEWANGDEEDFQDESDTTGIRIKINSMESSSGYNDITVSRFNYAPLKPQFFGKAPMVMPARITIDHSNITSIDADIQFDVARWSIKNPADIIVFHREFKDNMDYYWRVKARNDAGDSDWSKPQLFTTTEPYIRLTKPVGGEQFIPGLDYFITWDDNILEDVVIQLSEADPLNWTVMVIRYQLPVASNVKLTVYNILGHEINTLVNKRQKAGTYEMSFDALRLASGIYIYTL